MQEQKPGLTGTAIMRGGLIAVALFTIYVLLAAISPRIGLGFLALVLIVGVGGVVRLRGRPRT